MLYNLLTNILNETVTLDKVLQKRQEIFIFSVLYWILFYPKFDANHETDFQLAEFFFGMLYSLLPNVFMNCSRQSICTSCILSGYLRFYPS